MNVRLGLYCIIAAFASACTGGQTSTPQEAGFNLDKGPKFYVDTSDVSAIGQLSSSTFSVQTASPDYGVTKVVLDLTQHIQTQSAFGPVVETILPKSVENRRPLLLTVTMPELNTQFVDVMFDGVSEFKPGLASTLTYELLKNYPGKKLTDFDAAKFVGIKKLIQTRIDQMIAESEYLSLSSVPYDRLMRYFKNGLTFNIAFLTAIKQYGIEYDWTPITPPGLAANGTPEQSLDNYQVASAFKVGGSSSNPPFAHTNNFPKLMPGSASANPGLNINVLEGRKITLSVQAFDIDDDFVDKNFIIQYLPRVLPSAISGTTVIPEPTPEYRILTELSTPDGVDVYTTDPVAYNEALDLVYYSTDGDTAYRNVYYLVSDGSIRVPYRWNYKYADVNRQPKILRNASGKINETALDDTLAGSEVESPPGWRQHASHCETDENASYTDSNGTVIPSYQAIHNRIDGPWSCVFKMIDPDTDDDPNAAPDQFYYTVTQIDSFTEVRANGTYIWPPLLPYTLTNPKKVPGTILPTCTDGQGNMHRRCGLATYQITIDNAVKVAAEQRADLRYNYDVLIYDREDSGLSTQETITRVIQFLPIPPRILNFAAPTPDPTVPSLSQIYIDGAGNKKYSRFDLYLNELLGMADSGNSLGSITDIGFDYNLSGDANRSVFLAGSADVISQFITQPRRLNGTLLDFDPTTGEMLDGASGTIQLLGHSLTTADVSTYKTPREYDTTCSLAENNYSTAEGWDQRAPTAPRSAGQTGGWVFEVNAVDLDNVALRPGEPTDRVYLKSSHNIATNLFSSAGLFEYCWHPAPNSHPLTYQTYAAVGSLPAVDPDLCTWQPVPPVDMQPIPVYYKVVESGATKVKKLVYHRLRFKWRPKDQGMQGKTVPDPSGLIRNLLTNVSLNGNRYINNSETMDQVALSAPMQLLAMRKNMKPCTTGVTRRFNYLHQQSRNPVAVDFNVLDENKTLATFPYYADALQGRYAAEMKLLGTRPITDPEVLKWVPYVENCTARDTLDPAGASPTPPPTTSGVEPAILYSSVSDTNDIPHFRLDSVTNALPPLTGGFMCFRSRYLPSTVAGTEYRSVVLVQNLNTTSSYDLTLDGSCFSRTSLRVHPDQKYLALASRCTGYTLNQTLWSDTNSVATVKYLYDPVALGFSASSPMSFDLLPSMYGKTTDIDKNSVNSLFWELNPLDTFVFNATAGVPEYSGYGNWVPAIPANFGPTPAPVSLAPADYTFLIQYVDWDNAGPGSNLYLSIATPTPDPATSNVYFRQAPGDVSRIQVFSKNRAPASFPIATSDVLAAEELDPYDVHTFTLGSAPAPAPANPPAFSGINRASCIVAPAGYPAVNTLSYSGLADYRKCQFSWTPSAAGADDGRKFSYAFDVQDNFGGNATTMGEGGKHPSASGTSNVPGDSLNKTNGPPTQFFVDFEALETNQAPYFTATSNGAALNSAYNSTGGAAGWTNVYPGTNGVQPTCTTALCVASGDTLLSSTPVDMTEGVITAFTVYAKDNNQTAALKTITATKPTQILIVDGSKAGQPYFVPSFGSMSLNVSQNVAAGIATFSFSWTPTDAEANLISNSGGFLIPLVITDQQYRAASDPGFPSQFVTQPIKNTIWIWAKVKVKNNTPGVYLVNSSNVESALSGSTVVFQSGTAATYKIRVKDSDLARLQQSGETSGFSPVLSLPGFVSAQPAGTPYLSGGLVVQDMSWGGTAGNSDLGIYTTPTLTVTDPGDPSLGAALFPDAGSPPRARIDASGNSFTTPFTIQVIGKPTFLVPSATQNQVYAYSGQPFQYPLSLNISRPTEFGQAMFIGIDSATTVTPVKRTAAGLGLYVSQLHVLEWMSPVFTDITVPADRVIPLYGVRASYCNSALTSPAKTLLRYNKATSTIETCKLAAADVTTNLSPLQNITVTLVNGASVPALPAISSTWLSKTYAPAPTPSNIPLALDRHYADFKGRCGVICAFSPVTNNAAPSGLSLNPSGAVGSVEYTNNAYQNRFDFNTSGGYNVVKRYADTTPSTVRSISSNALKGDSIVFAADLSTTPGTPYPHYRWYVNGCLRAAGVVSSNQIQLPLLVKSDMSGLNNDCTGQYGYSEPSAGALGKLVVRLAIVNNIEAVNATSDGATSTYTFNVDVINNDPSLQTDPTITKSAPIALTSANYSGNQPSMLAMPVSYGGKGYFAYTDYGTAGTGMKVRLAEISASGALLGTGNMVVNCDTSFESQPMWFGIQPQSNGKLAVAVSTVTAPFPTGGSANLQYGISSKTCYQNTLSTSTPTLSFINLTGTSSVPAGYLAFSKYTQGRNPIASYNTAGGAIYKDGTNETSFFMLYNATSASQFWTFALQNIYSPVPAEMQAPYVSNVVRKSIVSGNKLFQLIGPNSNSSTGWRGSILISTLAANGSKVDATIQGRVSFAGPSAVPAAVAGDCNFDGAPIDGVYESSSDSLYVVANSNDGTGKGHFVRIQSVSTAPSCVRIGDFVNPSLDPNDFNPNLSKLVFDSARGLIYGLINRTSGQTSQFYTYDIYNQTLIVRDLSASIQAHAVSYAPEANALYLYDNRRTGAVYPVLYRFW